MGFYEKSNGADGSALWPYRNVRDKLIAGYQLTVSSKGSIYSLHELESALPQFIA